MTIQLSFSYQVTKPSTNFLSCYHFCNTFHSCTPFSFMLFKPALVCHPTSVLPLLNCCTMEVSRHLSNFGSSFCYVMSLCFYTFMLLFPYTMIYFHVLMLHHLPKLCSYITFLFLTISRSHHAQSTLNDSLTLYSYSASCFLCSLRNNHVFLHPPFSSGPVRHTGTLPDTQAASRVPPVCNSGSSDQSPHVAWLWHVRWDTVTSKGGDWLAGVVSDWWLTGRGGNVSGDLSEILSSNFE